MQHYAQHVTCLLARTRAAPECVLLRLYARPAPCTAGVPVVVLRSATYSFKAIHRTGSIMVRDGSMDT